MQQKKLLVDPAIINQAVRLVLGTHADDEGTIPVSLITKESLTSAFRKRALLFHPDRADQLGIDPAKLNELFKRFHGAYRLLNRLIEGEIVPHRPPSSRDHTVHTAETFSKERQRSNANDGMFTGPLPGKPLRFVQYLYYSGLIDWQTMIDAITWQSKVRPKIGEIGRTYKFLDHKEIITVIRQRKTGEFFGNVALRSGYVTRPQLLTMIGKQKNLNLPIGRYFLENHLFTRDELNNLIKKNNYRNAWFKRKV